MQQTRSNAGNDDDVGGNQDPIVVVGTGAGLLGAFNQSKKLTMSQMQTVVEEAADLNLIFVSMPSFEPSTKPTKYRKPNTGVQSIYWRSLDMMSQNGVPVVDLFQLTHSCHDYETCLVDHHGHGTRRVNRWKAQLFLNMLCEFKHTTQTTTATTPPRVHRNESIRSNDKDNNLRQPKNALERSPQSNTDGDVVGSSKEDDATTLLNTTHLRQQQTYSNDTETSRDAPLSVQPPESQKEGSNQTVNDKETVDSTVPAVQSNAQIRFVPFPHRTLDPGKGSMCSWVSKDATNVNDGVVSSLLGGDANKPDDIQVRLLRETVCVPESEKLLSRLHLFSTMEARQCLSNITLAIGGDSYNRQLFIGLAEILLSSPTNKEIMSGAARKNVLLDMAEVRRSKKLKRRQHAQVFPQAFFF